MRGHRSNILVPTGLILMILGLIGKGTRPFLILGWLLLATAGLILLTNWILIASSPKR